MSDDVPRQQGRGNRGRRRVVIFVYSVYFFRIVQYTPSIGGNIITMDQWDQRGRTKRSSIVSSEIQGSLNQRYLISNLKIICKTPPMDVVQTLQFLFVSYVFFWSVQGICQILVSLTSITHSIMITLILCIHVGGCRTNNLIIRLVDVSKRYRSTEEKIFFVGDFCLAQYDQ